MATARYKALKEFEYTDVNYGVGMSLILDPDAAQVLVEEGKIQLVKFLDPEDESDKREIDHFTNNPTGAEKPEDTEEEQTTSSADTSDQSDAAEEPVEASTDETADVQGSAQDAAQSSDSA